MKVALVQTPFWGVSGPPLGLACLSAYVKQRGYDVVKLDLNAEAYASLRSRGFEQLWTLNQPMWGSFAEVRSFFVQNSDVFVPMVERIIASGVEVVGFSILWSTEMLSRLIAAEIKKRAPSIKIVFGGPQCAPRVSCENLIDLPQVDFVIQGEGELTFHELLEAIRLATPTSSIDSVVSKANRHTRIRSLIRNLDSLPFPDFDDFRFELYRQPVTLPASTARGCPNRCYYCNEKAFWQTFRPFTGDRIFQCVKYQVERHGIRRFEFTDSLVNGKVAHLERFCDLVIESGLDIQWMGQAVVRKEMQTDLLVKIKRSGCFHLCFGMEHSSVDFMVKVGKVLSNGTDVDRFIRDCHDAGLPMGLNWMFGFPGESDEDFLADLEYFTRNSRFLANVSINNSPGFCGFVPGSYGHEHPDKMGIVLGPDGNTWKSKDGANTYVTRLRRFQAFCRHLDGLGIRYSFPVHENEEELIGDYYFDIENDYAKALAHYQKESLRMQASQASKERLLKCIEILRSRESGLCVYLLPDRSDRNWSKGVANLWATAFFVEDTSQGREDFCVGNSVLFADGDRRTIVRQKVNDGSLIVFLDGPPLDGEAVGHPNLVTVHKTSDRPVGCVAPPAAEVGTTTRCGGAPRGDAS